MPRPRRIFFAPAAGKFGCDTLGQQSVGGIGRAALDPAPAPGYFRFLDALKSDPGERARETDKPAEA